MVLSVRHIVCSEGKADMEHSAAMNGFGHALISPRVNGTVTGCRGSPNRDLESHAVDEGHAGGHADGSTGAASMVSHPHLMMAMPPAYAAAYLHSPLSQGQLPWYPQQGASAAFPPQGLSLSPTSQQPGATHVHIASDHPEDTAAASKNMMELHELWDEWRSFGERKLKGDQAAGELKRLTNRTVGISAVASQARLNRQLMVELLYKAAGVLEEHKQGPEAETLFSIGETMASLPSRGASVFQNIQNGGRQTVNSVSKPALHATLAAKNEADVKTSAHSNALAKACAWVEQRGGWAGALLAGAAAVVGVELLKRCAGSALGPIMGHHAGASDSFGWEELKRMRHHGNASERRRIQCEVANERGREYLQELRRNRINPFWHKDPPVNTCPMPSDNMPWRPEVPHY
ncbi:hypothetical protein CVIRNUC_008884 [Coccomyxa viridis]|uniref:Uncharacterized protein n=1 Tax=Coccomyxa viridis TaxID=1274662 RepID=A0AAV1IED0_9CHLO|nr:hypothetical protein CVIRNUC_008884 [Coccomyxa viridis]